MIKNTLNLFLLCCVLLLPSCKKDEQTVEASYIINFEIPAGTSFYNQQFFEVNSLRDSWLQQHGISASDVKSVQARYVRYQIVNSNDDFTWADKAYVKIAKYDPNQTTNPTYFEIGYNLQIPNTRNTYLDLVPNETELKDYFLADKFRIESKFINKIGVATSVPLQVRLTIGMSILKNN